MKVEGLFHIIHSEGQKVARWRRLPGCCCRRWCWSSRFIVLAGRRVRARAIATIEFGPELLPTSHPLTSSSTSNRGLKSNTSISHHTTHNDYHRNRQRRSGPWPWRSQHSYVHYPHPAPAAPPGAHATSRPDSNWQDESANIVTAASRKEMSDAKLPLAYRDSCAHLLIPLNKCRPANWYLPWKCQVRLPMIRRLRNTNAWIYLLWSLTPV